MHKISASILIIGNEILSGRVQDVNVRFIASHLPGLGIDLKEVRVIPDEKSCIVDTVLALSAKYDYVFTTGGIGPTHDDITFESIAEAFGLKLEENSEALERISASYIAMGKQVHPASAKMAQMPKGVALIDNNLTGAPGIVIKNVYVMAGIPAVMQEMFVNIIPQLKSSDPILSLQVSILIGESRIAAQLGQLQSKYTAIDMGSYPYIHLGNHATTIVLRGADKKLLESAFAELKIMVKDYEILA